MHFPMQNTVNNQNTYVSILAEPVIRPILTLSVLTAKETKKINEFCHGGTYQQVEM